jgi:sarcosine oxidase
MRRMSGNSSDVIVIGAGVMGANAAHQSAKDGASVRLIEQFGVGHALGSSHGPSRIIRLAYPEAHYLALARSAYALWRELEQESGRMLYFKTGGLDFGVPDALGLRDIGENYRAQGIAHEALDSDEIMGRFPQLRLADDIIGFYQPDYGMLHAQHCVETAVTMAQQHGAMVHEHEPVRRVIPQAAGVEVHTDAGVYRAARLILCAGSWMGPMLGALGLHAPLTITKEQVVYMQPRNPADYAIGRFPLCLQRFPGTKSLGSAFPVLGHPCPKLIFDHIGAHVAPEDPDRSVDPVYLSRVRDYALGLLPGLTGEVAEVVTCRYTMTPDEDFIIDTHPEHPHIVIASPCSGHGFKFGSVIGRILADLVLRGATTHDIARFRLSEERWVAGGKQ